MRLVLDTNAVVSGMLWNGAPRHLLEMAIQQTVSLYSSPALMDELRHVLGYPKFTRRLAAMGSTTEALLTHYAALSALVTPRQVPAVIAADPDDDHVLACAVAARAHLIASGDDDLHSLGGQYQGIRIVTPAEAVRVIEAI